MKRLLCFLASAILPVAAMAAVSLSGNGEFIHLENILDIPGVTPTLEDQFTTVGPDGAATARGVSSDKIVEEANPPAAIAFRDLRGQVRDVEGENVIISLSAKDGVVKGMQFAVYREEKWAGSLEAMEVRDNATICRPLSGERSDQKWNFKGGDQVRQRIDVLGEARQRNMEIQKEVSDLESRQLKFKEQLEEIANENQELFLTLKTADDPKLILETAQKIKEVINKRSKAELDYIEWLKEVIRKRQKANSGNQYWLRQMEDIEAAYRIEEKETELSAQLFSAWLEMIEAFTQMLPEFQNDEAALLERIEEYKKRGPPIAQYQLDYLKNEKAAIEKQIEKMEEEKSALRAHLSSLNAELQEIKIRKETWRSTGENYQFRKRHESEERLRKALAAGLVAAVEGKYAKAVKIFDSISDKVENARDKRILLDATEYARLLSLISARDNHPTSRQFGPPLPKAWTISLEGEISGAMRQTNGLLCALCLSQGGFALSAWSFETGKLVWQAPLPSEPVADCLLAGDAIYVVTEGPVFTEINIKDGTANTFDIQSNKLSARNGMGFFVATKDAVYYGENSYDDKWLPRASIWGVNIASHVLQYEKQFPGSQLLSLVADQDDLYVWLQGGKCNSRLKGVDETVASDSLSAPLIAVHNDGRFLQEVTCQNPRSKLLVLNKANPFREVAFPGMAEPSSFSSSNGAIQVGLVTASENGQFNSNLLRANVLDAQPVWQRITLEGRAEVSTSLVLDDVTFLLLHEGLLVAADTKTLAVKWATEVAVPDDGKTFLARFISTDGDQLVVQCGALVPPWTIYAFDKRTGIVTAHATIWERIAGTPLYRDGLLYFASVEGALYALDLSTEEMTWTDRLILEMPTLFLPAYPVEQYRTERTGLEAIPQVARKRLIERNAYGSGMPGVAQTLLMTDELLVHYRHRDRTLTAYRGVAR